jgi:hypothetical protein
MRGSSFGRLVFRGLTLLAAWWFASIPHNPVVRLEGLVGMSPSPLEKLVHMKGPFSGMTEGVHRLARGQVTAAFEANVLSPFVALGFAVCVLLGIRPRITTRRHELAFFTSLMTATILVNWFS